MYKVVAVSNIDNVCVTIRLITTSLFEDKAKLIADQLNNALPENCSFYHKVVLANQELNLPSMPYEAWLLATGADALPEHVAKYWYRTTILKKTISNEEQEWL